MKEKEAKRKEKEKAEKETEARLVIHARAKEGDFPPSGSLNKVKWEALRKFVNSVFDLHNSNITRLKYPFSRGEKARIQRLVNQHGKAALVDAIVNLSKSDILNGRKCYNRFWKASFYWLIEKDEHFEKVRGGYYDNPPEQQLPPAEARRLAEEAKKLEAAEERARQREIDEQISAEREAAREYAAAHAVTYEEYQAMKKQGLI